MAELTPSPDVIFGNKPSSFDSKSELLGDSAGTSPLNLSCPKCGSKKLWRDGNRFSLFGDKIQRWLCRNCGHRFSDPEDVQKAWSTLERIETVDTKSLKSWADKVTTRQICVTETKNLEAEQRTTQVPRRNEEENKGKIVEHAFWMQKEATPKQHHTQNTTPRNNGQQRRQPTRPRINQRNNRQTTKMVSKNKEIAVETYSCFLKMQGKAWTHQNTKPLENYIHTHRSRNKQLNRRMQPKNGNLPSVAQGNRYAMRRSLHARMDRLRL
jgi:rubredoxin